MDWRISIKREWDAGLAYCPPNPEGKHALTAEGIPEPVRRTEAFEDQTLTEASREPLGQYAY